MKTLFYNCPAGLCGDMNLGAMVDLGVEPDAIVEELQKLHLEGWSLRFEKDKRKGIAGTRCDVTHEDSHHHRTFADIKDIIENSALDSDVQRDAIAVFRALAEAEGAVHGKPPEAIHFHEVGAIDSIIDITGAAICWKLLGIDRVAASTVELGSGTVQCAHGRMPVPAPATAKLVKDLPVSFGGTSGEATTPTGAALLVGKECHFGEAITGKTLATGIGIGQRDDPAAANVVYVSLIEETSEATAPSGEVIELATNLDDMSPEHVAFLVEELLKAGALDVWQTPATFKKGRMGCVLSILIQPGDRESITTILLEHSTTLGVRWRSWNRTILDREISEKETPLGKVRVKSAFLDGRLIRSKVEFDDLSRIARENNLSLREVEEKLKD
ncbi:MAG: nickel pincer cofactor biosynthesis protein LarC [Puniceicoccaceae bacterium]